MPSTISDFLSQCLNHLTKRPPNLRTVERNLRLYAVQTVCSPLFITIASAAALRIPLLRPSGFEGLSFPFLFFLCLLIAFFQAAWVVLVAHWIAVRLASIGAPILHAACIAVIPTTIPTAISMLDWVPHEHFIQHNYFAAFLGFMLSETIVACSVIAIILFVREREFQAILDAGGLNIRVLRWAQDDAQKPQRKVNEEELNLPTQGTLQDLLSAPVKGPVLQIVAENKYIRVTTQNGEQLLSMSLTAAEEKLDPTRGMRIHRSVWLSWDAMGRIIYENGNPRILATTGTVHPISRKNVKLIRERQKQRDAAE